MCAYPRSNLVMHMAWLVTWNCADISAVCAAGIHALQRWKAKLLLGPCQGKGCRPWRDSKKCCCQSQAYNQKFCHCEFSQAAQSFRLALSVPISSTSTVNWLSACQPYSWKNMYTLVATAYASPIPYYHHKTFCHCNWHAAFNTNIL